MIAFSSCTGAFISQLKQKQIEKSELRLLLSRTDILSDMLSDSICGDSLTSWGWKLLDLFSRQFIYFRSYFSEQNIQSVPRLIWNYIQICFCQPGNVFITCLRPDNLCDHTFTCLRCHSDVIDNSKTVMWRLFFFCLFWLDKSLFESCNQWSRLLILFVCVSLWLSRLDTNCHCLHWKYLPTTWS